MGCGSSNAAGGTATGTDANQGDKYKIICNLGQGASCAVFKAKHKKTGKTYALKKLAKTDEINKSLWTHEKNILSVLKNPNVLSMIEAYEDPVSYCIVTVMCEGGELFDRVAAMDGGAFSEKVAARYAQQLLVGLAYCHSKNVAHRDLKPENYVFVSASDQSDLQLIDFGCAVIVEDNELVKDVCGSPYYIAPEVLDSKMESKRNGAMWRASDMWSIGVCVYLLVTGRPPFYAEDTRGIFSKIKAGRYRIPSNLSKPCVDFLQSLLVMEPDKRLTAAQALAHPWVGGAASSAPLNVAKSLGNFQHATRLKKAVAKALSNRLSDVEQQRLASAFKQLDLDGDGRLSASELSAMLGQAGEAARNLLKELDADGDDGISFAEFSAGMAIQSLDAEKAFAAFDVNNDGMLSAEEMAQQLSFMSPAEAAKLIAEVDSNKDGRISFQEWVAAMGDKDGSVKKKLSAAAANRLAQSTNPAAGEAAASAAPAE